MLQVQNLKSLALNVPALPADVNYITQQIQMVCRDAVSLTDTVRMYEYTCDKVVYIVLVYWLLHN